MGAREWALDQLATLGGTGTVMMGVLLVAGAAAAKGLFALHRYRSESRKEFLELWRQEAIHDDLWCEVAVRHLFGEYLPAALIRSLRTSPQAGRALLEISESWPLLEMNDETGSVTWPHDLLDAACPNNFASRFRCWICDVYVGRAVERQCAPARIIAAVLLGVSDLFRGR